MKTKQPNPEAATRTALATLRAQRCQILTAINALEAYAATARQPKPAAKQRAA